MTKGIKMLSFREFMERPLFIAEVGQNHQGELELAKECIKIFAQAGADVIKFQTRNNKYLFSQDAYNAPYLSENAFAPTYGQHREKLELKPEWLPLLKQECENYGIKFMSTPFDEPSLDILEKINVDIIKVASFDLGNLPFINRIGKKGKPVIISVGGGKINEVYDSVNLLLSHGIEVAVLHCVSEYPCEYHRLGLSSIKDLIVNFPQCTIGLSDHFNGTLSGPIAYLMGARVFEKHVTLNRSLKGTDHSFALEPEGFRKFVRDIKRTPLMLPPKPIDDLGAEQVFKKLGKSLVALEDIEPGQIIKIDMLSGKIFSKSYVPVRQSSQVIGRIAKSFIKKGDPIVFSSLEN
jgi:N-acetylneuraminate synthase/sialic acid synthase